jgi:hypothetical protein
MVSSISRRAEPVPMGFLPTSMSCILFQIPCFGKRSIPFMKGYYRSFMRGGEKFSAMLNESPHKAGGVIRWSPPDINPPRGKGREA